MHRAFLEAALAKGPAVTVRESIAQVVLFTREAAAIKLAPSEAQAIDEALEAMPMSDVFGGSSIRG